MTTVVEFRLLIELVEHSNELMLRLWPETNPSAIQYGDQLKSRELLVIDLFPLLADVCIQFAAQELASEKDFIELSALQIGAINHEVIILSKLSDLFFENCLRRPGCLSVPDDGIL